MSKYFIPGPAYVPEDSLGELARPMIGHRGKEYAALHQEVVERLKSLFDWQDYHVYLVTSSATGLMEGVVRNCIDKKILHTVCGAFSEKWVEISQLNGKETLSLDVPFGQAVKAEMIGEVVKSARPEAVTVTYCETSTGVLNPLEKLAAAIHEASPETLLMVDAVSAMGGVPLKMKEWGVDLLLFGLQKCFALPPGLSIAVVSERAYQKSLSVKNRGYYFNFEVFEEYALKNNTPTTPVIPLIYALRRQLERMAAEGLDKRYIRHFEMFRLIEKWCRNNGFEFYAQEGYRSPTVSAIKTRPGLNVSDFIAALKQRGFTISGGYGALKDETFRIGHMGETTPKDVSDLLEAMSEVLFDRETNLFINNLKNNEKRACRYAVA